jgi:hypothetical protein
MKNLADILREGDPAADSELSPMQVNAMRRVVLDATRRRSNLIDVARTPWHQPLAMATMVALMIAAGIITGRRLAIDDAEAPGGPGNDTVRTAPADQKRQLQFSTPGGTRIIWVFDPEFTMKETLP